MSVHRQAMWSSYYDKPDQILEIVRGALALGSLGAILIEPGAGADWDTHRVSLFTVEQFEQYLRDETGD